MNIAITGVCVSAHLFSSHNHPIIGLKAIFISDKERMFSEALVYLFVCLSICLLAQTLLKKL